MILAITPNTAIDRTAVVEALHLDTVLRPVELLALPGGKGINVARVARRLGAAVATTGFAGGHAGRWLIERLEAEGLEPRFVEISGETRTTYTATDTHRSLIVFEQGPEVTRVEVEQLLDLVDTRVQITERPVVVLSGSMPRGAVDGLAGGLVARCRSHGAAVIVDTTGPAFAEALSAGADVVKVNAEEAAEAGYGTGDLPHRDWPHAAIEIAEALRAAGAHTAIVTAGAKGAVARSRDETWLVTPPEVEVVSAVGSGDAFAAGIAIGIERGALLPDRLALAAAAGAANAARAGGGQLDPDHHRALLAETRTTPL